MNRILVFLVVTAMLAVGLPAFAGDTIHRLTLTNETGFVGGTAVVQVILDDTGSENISAYSLAICDDDLASIGAGDVVNGSGLAGRVFLFSGLGFPAGGWTLGVAFQVSPPDSLPPGENLVMYDCTYDLSAVGTAEITHCTLTGAGNPPPPPTSASLIGTSGKDILPLELVDGSIEIGEAPPKSFNFIAETRTVNYPGDTGAASFTEQFFFEENTANAGFPNATSSFQCSVEHDPAVLDLTDARVAGAVLDLNPAVGGFVGIIQEPSGGTQSGFTCGVVYNFTMPELLTFEVQKLALEADYDTVPGGLAGGVADTVTELAWSNLGSPATPSDILGAGTEEDFGVNNINGLITLRPVYDLPFIRADCNDDGIVNIADPVFTLNHLFHPPGQAAPPPGCLEACDANDDGALDTTDAVFTLNYQFRSGPSPSAPFPDCGTEEGADCAVSDSCQ